MSRSRPLVTLCLLGCLGTLLQGFSPAPLEASSREDKVQAKLEKAQEQVGAGDLEAARRSYHRAFKLSDGQSVAAALGLARIEIVLEAYDEAMEHVRSALEVAAEPGDQAAAHFLFGQAAFLRHAGDPKRLSGEAGTNPSLRMAETALRRAVQMGPPVRDAAAVLLTESLLLEGRRADARQVFGLLEGAELPEETRAHADAIGCELDLVSYEGAPESGYQPPVLNPSSKQGSSPSQEALPWRDGTAIIAFVVDSDGSVHCARSLRSYTPEGAKKLIADVEASTFQPATLDGKPIPARSTRNVVVDIRTSVWSFGAPINSL